MEQHNDTGVIGNLQAALGDWLRNFRAGQGQSRVDQGVQVALPVELWDWYTWSEQGTTASVPGGSSNAVVLYSVPSDRRALLQLVAVQRATGDNAALDLDITFALGYGSGNRRLFLLRLTNSATSLYWPNNGQSTIIEGGQMPYLLEPSSEVRLFPSGAGVAASTFTFYVVLRLSKVVRARIP